MIQYLKYYKKDKKDDISKIFWIRGWTDQPTRKGVDSRARDQKILSETKHQIEKGAPLKETKLQLNI